jgi:hypothetical protein
MSMEKITRPGAPKQDTNDSAPLAAETTTAVDAVAETAPKPNGEDTTVVQFPETAAPQSEKTVSDEVSSDKAVLDEFEQLEKECIIEDADGPEPGAGEEVKILPIEKLPPAFSNFRSNPKTLFDLWGTSVQEAMDTLVYVTTKGFAPNFEEDVELRRVRFYETVTAKDNVVRLVYCFLPEEGRRKPNSWIASKKNALDHSLTQWTTMRTRPKLQQYTHRPSRKDYGEPRFSGLTKGQLLAELKQQGLLILDKKHPFFTLVTDTEDDEDGGEG